MAMMDIKDTTRKTKDMLMPNVGNVRAFERLAIDITGRKKVESYNARTRLLVQWFGVPALVMAKLWEMIAHENDLPNACKMCHLLWALYYMQKYPDQGPMCKAIAPIGAKVVTEKTLSKWVWYFIHQLSELEEDVIIWERRKVDDQGDNELVSVDTTDCPFQQILIPHPTIPGKKIVNKALFSWKLNGPGLRYEIAVALRSSAIVHVNGPFCPGDWNDLEIFRHTLKHKLEPGERVAADAIYGGEAPRYVSCPNSIMFREEDEARHKRIEGRHELMNKHLKFWRCLKEKPKGSGSAREKMRNHSAMFRACLVIKQVSMDLGIGELWELE